MMRLGGVVAVFQSTLPLRGVTICSDIEPVKILVSIHTPLAGSDGNPVRLRRRLRSFNPHSPCGE